jgi:hypothetical protein
MISGAIFLATAVAWVRSYRNSETFYTIEPDGAVYALDTFRGEIAFWTGVAPADANPVSGHEHWEPPYALTTAEQDLVDPAGEDLWLLGFGYTTSRHFPLTFQVAWGPSPRRDFVWRARALVVPYWFVALVFIVVPAAWACRKIYGARQVRIGACARCGYDLRATTDRCPECGTPVPPANVTRSPARPAS